MRSKFLVVGLVAAMSTLATVSACSRTQTAAGEIAPATSIGLHVKNENFLDMDVFVVSQGVATRLGTVTGNASRDFMVDGSLAAQGLSIVATPIGGNGRAGTGSLAVTPGQTIDFTIGSILRNSRVFIR